MELGEDEDEVPEVGIKKPREGKKVRTWSHKRLHFVRGEFERDQSLIEAGYFFKTVEDA